MKRGPRRNFILGVASVLGAGLIALAAWELYVSRPGYNLPYQAEFTSSNQDRWTALGGTWEVADGLMRNESNDRGAKLLAGSANWKDYVIEGDLQLLGSGSVGLLARVNDAEVGENSFKGYLAGVRTGDNSLFIGAFDYAYHEAAKITLPAPVSPLQWYRIKLVVEGCQITASIWAANGPELKTRPVHDPDCVRSGRIGLRSNGTGGVWRNLTVKPIDTNVVVANTGSSPSPSNPRAFLSPQQQRDLQRRRETKSSGDGSPVIHAQSIVSLQLMPPFRPTVVSIRGSVVLTRPAIYVQDSTGGIEIQGNPSTPLKIGDEVEVSGSLSLDKSSPFIKDARFRLLREAIPVSPAVVTANQLADGYFDGRFVQVDGYLKSVSAEPSGALTLDLELGSQAFHAILPPGRSRSHFESLALQSRIRLRGVSVVDPAFNKAADPFVILVRSAEDLEVVAGPPWWRPSTLIFAALIVLALAFTLNYLYLLAKHWRLRAVADERERLAHEVHDTLAQSFAGIGFQLQAIRNSMPRDATALERQVEMAIVMARTSHEEARRSIASLRPESLGNVSLLPALRECAERMVKNGNVTVEVQGEDGGRVVPSRIKDTLFRIGQEAIANSIRHASPETIRIKVKHERASLCLSVEDDGAGFIADSNHAGFGLLGMRKRAESISATLEIKSTPGTGTRVEVKALVGPRFPVFPWSQRSFAK